MGTRCIRRAAWIAIGACAVCLGWADAAEPSDQHAGWYRLEDGTVRIVVPSARGGYRLIDPVEWTSDWLQPQRNGGGFEWREGNRPSKRRVRFEDEVLQWADGEREGRGRPMDDAPYAVELLEFDNDGLRLSGNVLRPHSTSAVPAVVMIHGSGNSDRDNVWYFLVAHRLAEDGFAVLLPDKRGCGQSEGDWREADLEDYAGDALAGVAALRTRDDIGPVGLLGVSQGGAIAPIAAQKDAAIAFVVNLSGSVVTLGEQVGHEIAQDLIRAGNAEDVDAAMDLVALSQHYIRTGEGWDAYAKRLEELSGGPHRAATLGFVRTPDNWYWSWWRGVIDVDSVDSWQEVEAPCLIVYGRDDERDNVPVSRSEARIAKELADKPNITLKVYEGTGHALLDPDRGGLHKDFLRDLIAWLKRATLKK